MKINEYASNLTKREGKKESLTVAQISEVLKLLNKDLWGVPYVLIRMKRSGKALAVLFLAFTLSGCATSNPFSGIMNPPKEPKKIATYAQTEKQVPLKIGVTPDGKDVIAYATERTYTAGSTETPEKLSFLQRLGRWIGGLSLIAGIFVFVSLLVFGGTPIVFLFQKYRAMKAALKNTIAAIDSMPPDAYEKLKPVLKEEQNAEDKTLIKKLKVDL